MALLKLIIPLFIVLGLLQAAVLALPFIYWRIQAYMSPINKFLLGSTLYASHHPLTFNHHVTAHCIKPHPRTPANTSQPLCSFRRPPPHHHRLDYFHHRPNPALPTPQHHRENGHTIHDLYPSATTTLTRATISGQRAAEEQQGVARYAARRICGLEGVGDAAKLGYTVSFFLAFWCWEGAGC